MFTFDPKTRSVYVEVADGIVASTRPIKESQNALVDLDSRGRVLGVEIIDLLAAWPFEAVQELLKPEIVQLIVHRASSLTTLIGGYDTHAGSSRNIGYAVA